MIHSALRVVNQEQCDPPLSDTEVAAIATSVGWYPPAAADASVPAVLPPAPPFPTSVLPGAAWRLVEEASRFLGCPADAVAVPLLVFVGATIGNRYRLRLKHGFELLPILWAAVVMPPGSVKTPALDAARKPLDTLQREAYQRYETELVDHRRALDHWAAEKDKQARGVPPEPPQLEHFFSTDATTEAIARLLSSSAGVALIYDELVGWVKSFDAYRSGRGGDRQRMLSLWSGTLFKVDRKGAEPILNFEPAVSIVGGIQPDVLRELAHEAGRRDGFLERVLWSYPDTEPAEWRDEEISGAAYADMTQILRVLRTEGDGGVVELHPDARRIWVDWYNEGQRLTARMDGLAAGLYAKLPMQCARLALVLHCLACPEAPERQPLSPETLAGAIELAEYFRAHGQRALAHFEGVAPGTGDRLATRCLVILVRAGDWMNLRALDHALGGHVPAAQRDSALALLEADGLAERRQSPAKEQGGRPGTEWRAIVGGQTDKRANQG